MTDDLWHTPLVHVRGRDVRGDTGQTSGMTRLEAISGKSAGSSKLWMGQTHVAPVTKSGDHHHGHAETAIYVVSGHPSRTGRRTRATTKRSWSSPGAARRASWSTWRACGRRWTGPGTPPRTQGSPGQRPGQHDPRSNSYKNDRSY
jgi:hypothetical protein